MKLWQVFSLTLMHACTIVQVHAHLHTCMCMCACRLLIWSFLLMRTWKGIHHAKSMELQFVLPLQMVDEAEFAVCCSHHFTFYLQAPAIEALKGFIADCPLVTQKVNDLFSLYRTSKTLGFFCEHVCFLKCPQFVECCLNSLFVCIGRVRMDEVQSVFQTSGTIVHLKV